MPSHRIVDASPLILLAKVGRLDLPRAGVDVVVVPDVIWGEVHAKGSDDPASLAISRTTWLDLRSGSVPPDLSMCSRLDAGEAGVIALAWEELEDSDVEVVIDDLDGRSCARRLGIPCLGTLGVVLFARQLDIIPAARPVVVDLRQAGPYLDERLAEEVSRRAG